MGGDFSGTPAEIYEAVKGVIVGKIGELYAKISAAANATVEKMLFGDEVTYESKPDALVDYGWGVKAPAGQRMWLNGIELQRHRNGGGWVPVYDDTDEGFVPEDVYVGHRAIVFPGVKVFDGVLHGGTFLGGAVLSGKFYGGYFDGRFDDPRAIYAKSMNVYHSSADADNR